MRFPYVALVIKSPTQMKCTCNATYSTYITLCVFIRIKYFGYKTQMLCTFFPKTCLACWYKITFKGKACLVISKINVKRYNSDYIGLLTKGQKFCCEDKALLIYKVMIRPHFG